MRSSPTPASPALLAALALLSLSATACKRSESAREALGQVPAAGAAAEPPAPVQTTAGLAAQTWSDAACEPSKDPAVKQRAGYAKLTLDGDGLGEMHDNIPALCGALHTAATKRFAVGDGTLFRVCIPGGGRFQISSDVVLSGPLSTEFTYENYKKTGPLIELYRPEVGTYNQRDTPAEHDKLDVAFDWSTVAAELDLVWPSKKDRVVHVKAHIDCGGALR